MKAMLVHQWPRKRRSSNEPLRDVPKDAVTDRMPPVSRALRAC